MLPFLESAVAACLVLHIVRGRSKSFVPPRTAKSAKVWIGVDLGGTTVSVGSVNDSGNLLCLASEDIAERSFAAVCALIVKLIRSVADDTPGMVNVQESVAGIGIGAPGMLDIEQGMVRRMANLAWEDAPLVDTVASLTGCCVVLENDANTALLAETWIGAARGLSDVVMVTLGSGIGGAAICNGVLLRGAAGLGMEIGHMVMERGGRLSQGTGVRGVYEEYGSARAVGIIAREAIATATSGNISKPSHVCFAPHLSESMLFFLSCGTTPPSKEPWCTRRSLCAEAHITCKEVFTHAKAGDELALSVVEKATNAIGILCINLCRVLDPELIVLSGGMANAGEPLLSHIRAAYMRNFWTIQSAPSCQIVFAQTGNTAGVIGAAAAAMRAVPHEARK